MRSFYNITFRGKKYKAIDGKCWDCAIFPLLDVSCGKYKKLHCLETERKDKKRIIWMEISK